MLTNITNVQLVPFFSNTALYPVGYLNMLIADADAGVKSFLKRDPELKAYEQYLDGNEQPNLVLKQYPVLAGVTQVAVGSNGAVLPQATINVVTTNGSDGLPMFDDYSRGTGRKPSVVVQTGQNSWTTVQYTGLTATSFTGCTGGTGTMSSQDGLSGVSQPVVFVDYQGYAGQVQPDAQGQGPFPDASLMVLGGNYVVDVDDDSDKSQRGLLRRVGGFGPWNGFMGLGQAVGMGVGGGKLASWRRPCWPRGDKNIRVLYSAGYATVPADLTYAATMLVTYMAGVLPAGALLSSESLGAYSYSLLQSSNDVPALGSINVTLRRYREVSW